MKKRFRDDSGMLTMSLAEIAEATQAEADAYYKPGLYYVNGGIYYLYESFMDVNCHGEPSLITRFVSAEGKCIFTVPSCMGTFLPDVASDGLEYVLAEDQEKAAMRYSRIAAESQMGEAPCCYSCGRFDPNDPVHCYGTCMAQDADFPIYHVCNSRKEYRKKDRANRLWR